jgi:hypothetical protein
MIWRSQNVYHYGPGELPQNVICAIDDFYWQYVQNVMRKVTLANSEAQAEWRKKRLTLVQ